MAALDWVDGPTLGFLEIEGIHGAWYFRLLAEHQQTQDGSDSRLFELSAAAPGVVDELVVKSGEARNPDWTGVWVPRWQFSDAAAKAAADAFVEQAVSSAGAVAFIMRTGDLHRIAEVWRVARPSSAEWAAK
ncbi:hypothetical protein [Actinospica robiniae]|uniref:hypothetical protein n=1 Tax=Actinospica robiniae TaxID=304901 RepID=UPI0012FBAC76|nr:hypothetical protein [Actinospica robiniae]